MSDVLTFDRLEAGMRFGEKRYVVDEEMRAAWQAIFPGTATGQTVPRGLLVAVLMRGYIEATPDRPPGNVHAGQTLTWHREARFGERLAVATGCLSKEERKGRLWARFDNRVTGEDGPVLTGEMLLVWAR